MRTLIAALLALPLTASAVPFELTHQGRLLDPAGGPLNGGRVLTFEILGDSGAPVWTQTSAVRVEDGYYGVVLGPGGSTALTPDLLDGDRSLRVREGSNVLGPAVPLRAVPYAIRAASVTGPVSATEVRVDGPAVLGGVLHQQRGASAMSFHPYTHPVITGGWAALPADHLPGAAGSDGFTLAVGYVPSETTTVFLTVNDNTNDSVFIGGGGATCCSATWRGLRVFGSGSASLTGTLATSQGAMFSDLAENVPAEGVEPGDVVAVRADSGHYPHTPFIRASQAYDTAVVGVVTDSAAMSMATAEDRVPLALSGLVRVKVDASYGAVRPGDLLVASPTPGHAMRAEEDRPGAVIGKALEPLEAGTDRVLMLVMMR